jgi:hypothetical protein
MSSTTSCIRNVVANSLQSASLVEEIICGQSPQGKTEFAASTEGRKTKKYYHALTCVISN